LSASFDGRDWRTVVWSAVCSFDVVHEVLHKVNLLDRVDDMQAGSRHLSEVEEIDRRSIELQMAPFMIAHDCHAGRGIELGMNRMRRVLRVLEELDLVRLAHHGREQTAHQLDDAMLELVGATVIVLELSIGLCQAPNSQHAVYIIANPRIAVSSRWQHG